MGKILVHNRVDQGNILGSPSSFWGAANEHHFDKEYVVEVGFVLNNVSDEIQLSVDDDSENATELFIFDNTTPRPLNFRFVTAHKKIRVIAFIRSEVISGGPYNASFTYTISAVHGD